MKNNNYSILEVNDNYSKDEFFELPKRLYKNEKHWICPLRIDIEKIFDPQRNKFFKNGKCIRWIIQDTQKNTIGRVAAFINYRTKDIYNQPTGGMGFFESINDKKTAFHLLDTCKSWLETHDIEAMDGPINFGPRNEWWGLLTEGHEHRPVYNMPYTHKYYKSFFEEYGFKIYFKQYTYLTVCEPDSLADIVRWKASRLFKNPDYIFKHYRKKQLKKFVSDFVIIYNNAWVADIPGASEVTFEEVYNTFKLLNPLVVEKIVWFAYCKKQPIGFFIVIPDLNEILKHLNGKINWKGRIIFLWYKYFAKKFDTIGIILGVDPKFQKRGIEAGLIKKYTEITFQRSFKKYKNLEMNWIGDFNPRMIHLMDHVGGRKYKTHITYRKLFDESKKFERSPIIS